MMERYINCPEAVAAMRAGEAVTGEPIDAMGVYRHDGFCWSTEDLYNFKGTINQNLDFGARPFR